MKQQNKIFILGLLVLIGGTFWAVLYTPTALCTPIPLQNPEKSNHGWQVWRNDFFVSFTPDNSPYCIETGWEALGAAIDESGHAQFSAGSSGVVIKTSEFDSHTLVFGDDKTTLRVLHPVQMPNDDLAEYLKIIESAFKNVGTLYRDVDTAQLNGHVVLITVGLAGDATEVENSVYPTPTKDVTVLMRNKNHRRGEELFIHAVAHLYNRHLTSSLLYQQNQAPMPAEDWQELEASWTEIIFRSDKNARRLRVRDLHEIHTAIVTDEFSPALEFPFNNPTIYGEVYRTSVILGENPTYAETQYSHYVLAPLILLAIEGILTNTTAETSVSALLQQARVENKNFFALLQNHLSDEDSDEINNFIFGRKHIPFELLDAGLTVYEQ